MGRVAHEPGSGARRAARALGALALLTPALVMAQSSGDLNTRLERLERIVNTSTLVDLLERVDALSREVRDLRGQVELQGYELGQLKERQRELYLDVDGRMQRLEQGGVAMPDAGGEDATATTGTAGGSAAQPASPAPQPEETPTVDPLAEQADYQAAFNLLKEGRYDEAAGALDEFLGRYPSGAYADNAQYWLGESYYVTRRFPEALAEFEELVANFPASQKFTHSLLKIGYIHDEMGNRADARRVLEELVGRYPGSAAAGLARKRLERLQ